MCGIAGAIGTKEYTAPLIKPMLDRIIHRGPDDEGTLIEDTFAFGMRRLSIIDLAGGKQPIFNEDDSMSVVFNGEIYNYKELRPELEKQGHIFKTHSDTEGLIHLYEQYGTEMLLKLRGMFGFAIYDSKKQQLFIGRDYFGIKPIYYRLNASGKVVGFASEIKSLLVDPTYKAKVNNDAVYNYLAFQFNPLEETMFKGIFRLLPGHYMTIDLKNGNYVTKKYWSYEFAQDATDNEQKLKEKVRATVEDSVEHHMISDVPVGSFLSGGVDSAIIVTTMQKLRQGVGAGPVSTFTIGFDHVSEHSEARVVADRVGSDHTEIKVSFDEYFNELPKIAWHFDEPVADPSAVALYFLAREARKKVKVVLSGEGADELFGGYNIYREPFALSTTSWIPKSFILPFIKLPFNFFGKNYLRRAITKIEDRYIGNAYIFKKSEQERIWKNDSDTSGGKKPPSAMSLAPFYSKVADQTDSRKMQYIDMNFWLPGDILAKADRMTMAHSLELRVPFLDKEVARLSEMIPEKSKYARGASKYILRKAFESVLPQETSERKKLGFPTPIKQWLKERPEEIMKIILRNPYVKSHMNMDYVLELAADHASGKTDNARKIYTLLMFSLWYEQFIAKA